MARIQPVDRKDADSAVAELLGSAREEAGLGAEPSRDDGQLTRRSEGVSRLQPSVFDREPVGRRAGRSLNTFTTANIQPSGCLTPAQFERCNRT